MGGKKITPIAPPSRLLAEREVAVMLGVSVRSLQNSRYASHRNSPLAEIPIVKLGVGPRASVRYEEVEVARFIANHRVRREG